MEIEFYTSFPPSINNYYVKTQRGMFIAMKGKKFRADVEKDVNEQLLGAKFGGKALVEVYLFPPDKRRRDVDNYIKPLFDAITHASLWEDDSQVDQMFVYRGQPDKRREGMIIVKISEAGPLIPFGETVSVSMD